MHVVEGRGFFPHILIYFECQKNILSEYRLPSHVKDSLETSSRSHAIPGLSKLLQTLHFLVFGSFQHTVAYFLYCLFATMLICAAFAILHWSICK